MKTSKEREAKWFCVYLRKEELKLAKASDGGSGGSQGGVCVACISRKDNHIV